MKSILQYDRYICWRCLTRQKTECHHVFEGTANRKKSEEDGMKIYLCHGCHMYLHDHPKASLVFKERAQRVWEEKHGNRDAFIKRYGRSYL